THASAGRCAAPSWPSRTTAPALDHHPDRIAAGAAERATDARARTGCGAAEVAAWPGHGGGARVLAPPRCSRRGRRDVVGTWLWCGGRLSGRVIADVRSVVSLLASGGSQQPHVMDGCPAARWRSKA